MILLRPAGLLLLACLALFAQTSPIPVSTPPESSADDPFSPPPDTPPPATCPAGGPIGAIKLGVQSPRTTDKPLSLDKITSLSEGDTVLYSPVLRGKESRHGEVALVLVPLKHDSNNSILVTDPKPADKPQQWKVDQTVTLAAYVYGPAGLSKKKVKGFLAQDDLLIAQLADYAAKTAQTQALVAALQDANSSAESINAALNGFAAQYGVTAPIDRAAPTAVQAQTLFATINPQLASYDPLTPSSGARLAQTASLATVAAGLFFGNPIGLAAGGTAMLLDLRAIAFPGTEFRSSFAGPLNPTQPDRPELNLCGQRTPAPPHTRVAYIWANRIPNAPIPALKVGAAHYVAQGQKSPVPVDLPEKDWRYLDRARDWTLTDAHQKSTPIKVVKLANQKAIELDLTKAALPPGDYHLVAYWDWQQFQPEGSVSVRPLSDFKQAKLEASSQDRLLAHSGKLAVTVEDADFEFTSKVELKKMNDEFATAVPIPFILPKGLRQGPQGHMDVQISSADLDPGDYQLLISQSDGRPHSVQIKVLPSPPQIANLPILANQGVNSQHFVLKGQHLSLLTRLEAPGVQLHLEPASADESERSLSVQLAPDAKPGNVFPVSAFLKDRTEPIVLSDALKITGPLPLIASSRLSLPANAPVSLSPGEFPAGATLSAMLDVKNAAPRSSLRVSCQGDTGNETEIGLGEQNDKWSLQQLSPDQLFLSLNTSQLPAGCLVQVVLDNHAEGRSAPYALAHLIRMPDIDQMTLANEPTMDGKRVYQLTGANLEMMDRVGWDQLTFYEIASLPVPVAGSVQQQTLRIALPEPPTPTSNLYIWLRGDKLGRSTTVVTTPASRSGSAAAPITSAVTPSPTTPSTIPTAPTPAQPLASPPPQPQ